MGKRFNQATLDFETGKIKKSDLALVALEEGLITPEKFQSILRREAVKVVAEALTTPQRIGRAVVVGAKTAGAPRLAAETLFPPLFMLRRKQPPIKEALQRALAAAKPGFVPQRGEKLASFLGEMAGTVPLTMPVAVGAKALLAGKPILQTLLSGGAATAELSALRQAEEEGKVSPKRTVKEALGGAALAGAFPSGAKVMGVLGKGAKQIAPGLFRQTAGVTPEATRELIGDPSLLKKFKGLPETIEEKVSNIQNVLNKTLSNFGKAVDTVKQRFGVVPSEARKRVLKEGITRYGGEISDDLDLVREVIKNPGDVQRIEYKLLSEGKTEKIPLVRRLAENKQERLKFLLELKEDIDENVTYAPGIVKKIRPKGEFYLKEDRTEIKNLIGKEPGGKLLNEISERYSKVRKVYDALQKDLETVGKAERKGKGVFRLDAVANLTNNKDFLDNARELERLTGKPLLKPLMQELSAAEFKPWIPTRGLPLPATPLAFGATVAGLGGHPLAGLSLAALMSPKVIGTAIPAVSKVAKSARPLAKFLERPEITGPTAAITLNEMLRRERR